jgi:uncharacterized protein YcaQ
VVTERRTPNGERRAVIAKHRTPGSKRRTTLSIEEARKAVLWGQGFGNRTSNPITQRHLVTVLKRVGMLQIDSVNVLMRAHYLPLFSRLGPYPVKLLDEASYSRKRRRLFEYWGHEASLLPLESFPLLRWRMERASRFVGTWRRLAGFAKSRPDFIEKVVEVVKEHGPAGAGEIERHLAEERPRGSRGWWSWTDSKLALEFLFWCGRITTATRRNFERLYDLTERIIPHQILATRSLSLEEAQRQLIRIASRALGLATESDLRDYFRFGVDEARTRIAELVESGELLPVIVENWKAYLDRDAKIPRRVDAQALISPFDPLIWERKRPERLFRFRYRIGIYTPAHKRGHGYYVLPFLMGDQLVARVDLKADRKLGGLQVLSAHAEPGIDRPLAGEALARELALLGEWLGLDRIHVADRGDLASSVRLAINQ